MHTGGLFGNRLTTTREGADRAGMTTISPRGPISASLLGLLPARPESRRAEIEALGVDVDSAVARSADPFSDDDLQLALLLLYSLSYGSLPGLDDDWEWDPGAVAIRRTMEKRFEAHVRDVLGESELPEPDAESVAAHLFNRTREDEGPSVARFIAKNATDEQVREFVIHRSIYTLREADPHSWAIPRLTGRAKAALVEVQSDEYGGGRPDWIHARIFAKTMESLGLNSEYGAYIDDVPAETLASFNLMSMFGLNRRLRGAIVGHLAAFEMTSSIPNRHYGNGFRRLGYGPDVTLYFDEHVEADAVHEQIAGRDLAGGLAEAQPELLPDIIFGARACLYADGLVGRHLLSEWQEGRSSLRTAEAVA